MAQGKLMPGDKIPIYWNGKVIMLEFVKMKDGVMHVK